MKEISDPGPHIVPKDVLPAKIGIVTITYNSGLVLPDFVKSIDQQSHIDFLVVMVDNASTDDTLDQLRIWGSPKLVLIANSENRGVAAGNNQGIRAALAAGCEYVLLINNDVVFGPDLLRNLLTGLVIQSCDLATPLIYFHDAPNRIWAAGGGFQPLLGYRVRHFGENEIDSGQYDHPGMIQYAPTCCVLIRKKVFERIGLMDERYFVYSDDVDFMYRALCANIRSFPIPQAKLWHKVSSLTGGSRSDFTLYYSSRGRTLFIAKHFGTLIGAAWVLIYSVFYPLRSLVGNDSWRQVLVRLRGIFDGYKVGRTRFEA